MSHVAFILVICAGALARAQSATALQLPKYETRYYTIYTDLPEQEAREAAVRMNAMAAEYALRTRDFAGSVNSRFPFFLHARMSDYVADGGQEGTDGYFDGAKLVAFGGMKGARSWSTVQHEGFHQFAHRAIGQTLPAWVDEGLAEYFGEAIFTGDGYVSGVAPSWRVKRIKKRLTAGGFIPTAELIKWDTRVWNDHMDIANYDHAWAMVQFLAHADNGKYRKAFSGYIAEVGAGRAADTAWNNFIGPVEQFDARWRKWWLNLPEDVSDRQYVSANVAVFTSLLARAASQKQTFDNFEKFIAAAKTSQIRSNREDWLPQSLAESAADRSAEDTARLGLKWSLGTAGRNPTVVCQFKDGSKIVGKFTLRGDRVGDVSVTDRK